MTQRRDHALDAVRGVCLMSMVAAHVGDPTWLNWALHLPGFTNGASGFVLVSGIALGIVSARRVGRIGMGGAISRILRRAGQLWLAHLFLALGMLCASEAMGGMRSVPPVGESGGWGVVLLRVAALIFQPTYMDILPMYIWCLLAAVPTLLLMPRGWAIPVAISLALYLAVQWDPMFMNFGLKRPGLVRGFHVWAWQFLFVGGLAIGWKCPPALWRIPVWTSAVVCAALIALVRWPGAEPLFDLYTMGVARLLGTVAGLALLHGLLSRAPGSILGVFALPGRHALTLFVAHFAFIFLGYGLTAPSWHPAARELYLLASLAALWLLARAIEQWRERKPSWTPSPASPSP